MGNIHCISKSKSTTLELYENFYNNSEGAFDEKILNECLTNIKFYKESVNNKKLQNEKNFNKFLNPIYNENKNLEKNKNLNDDLSNSLFYTTKIHSPVSKWSCRNTKINFKNDNITIQKQVINIPENLRWISWLKFAEIPLERNEEIYLNFYNEKLDEKIEGQIKKDLNRTFTKFLLLENMDDTTFVEINNSIQQSLFRVLRAFSNCDKEVSYCQGMNFIAGFLLIASDFDEVETFFMLVSLFSNTFNDKFGIRGFFMNDFIFLKDYLNIFHLNFSKMLPKLKTNFDKFELPNEVWIGKWIQTLYTIYLPLNLTVRLWNCLMIYGLKFLICFSLSFLSYFEEDLIKLEDAFEITDYFKKIFVSEKQPHVKVNFEFILNDAVQKMETIKMNFNDQDSEKNQSYYNSNLVIKYNLNLPIKQMKLSIENELFLFDSNSIPDFKMNNKDSLEIINQLEEVNDIKDCVEENSDSGEDIITLNISSHIMTPRSLQK